MYFVWNESCLDKVVKEKQEGEKMIDNYDLWCEYDANASSRLARMPVCECCGEHIQTETAFNYNGQWFCIECEKEVIELVWEEIKSDYLFDVED